MIDSHRISVEVNGQQYDRMVEARTSLADFLRHELHLTGTHLGCEHGVCGACTVLVDGASTRSCLMLAVRTDRCAVETVESLSAPDQPLHPLQAALARHHGLQCGYCTPGVLMTILELQRESVGVTLTEDAVRRAMSGNLCRCTGYQGIVDAVLEILSRPMSAD